jgi:hypothetical protein
MAAWGSDASFVHRPSTAQSATLRTPDYATAPGELVESTLFPSRPASHEALPIWER